MAVPNMTSNGDFWHDVRAAYATYRKRSFLDNSPGSSPLNFWKTRGLRVAYLLFGTALPAIILHQLRDRLVRRGIPLLPYLCELISMAIWHVSLGRNVEMGPEFYIAHGYVAMDGFVKIGRNCSVGPWVSVGMMTGSKQGTTAQGPTIGDDVWIGTSSNLLGPISIGDGVLIGAHSVVISDVPAGATVVGAPARVIRIDPPGQLSDDGSDRS